MRLGREVVGEKAGGLHVALVPMCVSSRTLILVLGQCGSPALLESLSIIVIELLSPPPPPPCLLT